MLEIMGYNTMHCLIQVKLPKKLFADLVKQQNLLHEFNLKVNKKNLFVVATVQRAL